MGFHHETFDPLNNGPTPVSGTELPGPICVSRSRSRDEGCSALRNRLIGSRLQTA
ncbi:hypothetical protein [Pasteuria penetrans]|uniref:hypothetical protein n=1 Tax=Pasteuria penetrans TaxID=86005 RepID=UPI00165B11AD|nr:hypothetical protein [Pasteuria penetrans]